MNCHVALKLKSSFSINGLKVADAGDSVVVLTVTDIVVAGTVIRKALRTASYIIFWSLGFLSGCLWTIGAAIGSAVTRLTARLSPTRKTPDVGTLYSSSPYATLQKGDHCITYFGERGTISWVFATGYLVRLEGTHEPVIMDRDQVEFYQDCST